MAPEPRGVVGDGSPTGASEYLTKERAEEILREAFPGATVQRTMCGRCGEWSDYYPFGDLSDTPPGWTRTRTDEHAWGSAPRCPKCQEAARG